MPCDICDIHCSYHVFITKVFLIIGRVLWPTRYCHHHYFYEILFLCYRLGSKSFDNRWCRM